MFPHQRSRSTSLEGANILVGKHSTLLTSSNISIVNDTGAFRSFSTIWSAVVWSVFVFVLICPSSPTVPDSFENRLDHNRIDFSFNQLRKLIPLINRKSGLPHDIIAESTNYSPYRLVTFAIPAQASLVKFLTSLADEKPAGRRLSCISHLCLLGSWCSIFDIPLPSPVNRYEYKLKVWSKLDRKLLTLWKHQGPFWLHIVTSYWLLTMVGTVELLEWVEIQHVEKFSGCRPKITTWSCPLGQTTDWCQWWCLAISAR